MKERDTLIKIVVTVKNCNKSMSQSMSKFSAKVMDCKRLKQTQLQRVKQDEIVADLEGFFSGSDRQPHQLTHAHTVR